MDSQISCKDYLRYVYSSTYMPLHYFEHHQLLAAFPTLDMPVDYVEQFKEQLLRSKEEVFVFSPVKTIFMGIVQNHETGQAVVVGPAGGAGLTEEDYNQLTQEFSLDINDKKQVRDYYAYMPNFSLPQFYNILALVNCKLNGRGYDAMDALSIENADTEQEVGERHSERLVESKENETYHDTYYFEQTVYSFVEKGDVDGLLNFLRGLPTLNEGRTATDSLRQAKNIFISATALLTRHAIAGGLDIETAYQLSDSYILQVEKMTNIQTITNLNLTALTDFTQRVSEAKIPMDMSREIYTVIQYISNHVNQPITVEEIAEKLHMDRSTLSKKFKRELGFNISSYIMRRKLEEAKSLLHYSDKSINEISEYLCFSSQSYFQNVFKHKYGMTPKEYRKNK